MSNEPDITIRAIGVHSSLGGALDAGAAFRAGRSRARDLPTWPYSDKNTNELCFLTGHPAAAISDGFAGPARWLKLLRMALADVEQAVAFQDLDLAKLESLWLFPGLNIGQETSLAVKENTKLFFERLWRHTKIKALPNPQPLFSDRAGIVELVRKAGARLATGKVDQVLISAVDSLLDAPRIGSLLDDQALKTTNNPKGLLPGEAACAILLEREGAGADRRDELPQLLLAPPSEILSAQPDRPPDGTGLSEVLQRALANAQIPPRAAGTLYCDLNGSDFRASDMANALVRLAPASDIRHWPQELPALSFGDTGAASGLLAICLAVRAFRRGYLQGDLALVSMASHANRFGAVVVRR